ncbi:MAG: hypothetical protein ACK5E3_14655, partial [Planctomycetota bacterium]
SCPAWINASMRSESLRAESAWANTNVQLNPAAKSQKPTNKTKRSEEGSLCIAQARWMVRVSKIGGGFHFSPSRTICQDCKSRGLPESSHMIRKRMQLD